MKDLSIREKRYIELCCRMGIIKYLYANSMINEKQYRILAERGYDYGGGSVCESIDRKGGSD